MKETLKKWVGAFAAGALVGGAGVLLAVGGGGEPTPSETTGVEEAGMGGGMEVGAGKEVDPSLTALCDSLTFALMDYDDENMTWDNGFRIEGDVSTLRPYVIAACPSEDR